VDDFAFGLPARFLQLNPDKIGRRGEEGSTPTQAWDAALDVGCDVYSGRMHNLCCDNCHSHVARCLNEMRYGGRTDWNMVTLAAWLFFQGKYVSTPRTVAMWLPFLVVVLMVLGLRYGVLGGR
jgi:hypothetical protein